MATQRERTAEQIRTATRWDRPWALLAADHLIAAGKYDVKREYETYDSIQWLLSLTNAEILGDAPVRAWFANMPEEQWRLAHLKSLIADMFAGQR